MDNAHYVVSLLWVCGFSLMHVFSCVHIVVVQGNFHWHCLNDQSLGKIHRIENIFSVSGNLRR